MDAKNYKILIIIILFVFSSCIKDKPDSKNWQYSKIDSGSVYIVCEGGYTNYDVSLYAYEPIKDSVYGDLFFKPNNLNNSCDVFQNMTKIGNNFFFLINNSNKIIVADAVSLKPIASISIPQPRYILPLGNNKAYVTSLYSNKVYIINTLTYTVTGILNLPNVNTESMCLYNNSVIICTWDTTCNKVYKINTQNDKIVGTLKVTGKAPQETLIDNEGTIWVLAGNQPMGKTATLTRIDTLTGEILHSFTFPADANPIKLITNNTKDSLYFIEADYSGKSSNNGIYRMGTNDNQLPENAFISALPNQYFYAIGIDPVNGTIFIGDPVGFSVGGGTVYAYNPTGTFIKKFKVGIGPGHFYFDK